ncbi:hypothetical protein ASG29_15095 [Sphingomonas sp. Leaf412]|uniref:DUF2442 domain-containing protein n=1 Tax=Sphingomonas sp. Leaf412 TaxID=1736370 RepID=UPI0006FB015A|nr:DUF2442 domain-containing protein [Sphingomonas sp. Leaf412]KQT31288.1 hypothetical protein ASG29_15095 [Sphingomonas sp. Leaf412]
MADLTDAQVDAANAHGEEFLRGKPLARAVRYDRTTRMIVIDLTNGSTFAFPPTLAQGLEQATPEQLDGVEISGGGFGLHWEALDVDFTVPGLLAGRFGTARYMRERFGEHWNAAAAE